MKSGPLVASEALARLSSYGLIAYVTRKLGAEGLGLLGVAQTLGAYIIASTEAGTRLIGAKLFAQKNLPFRRLLSALIQKRMLSGLFSFALGLSYVIFTSSLSQQEKIFAAFYLLALTPYIFSVDWALHGLEKYKTLALWRFLVNFGIFSLSILLISLSQLKILSIPIATGISWTFASIFLLRILIKNLNRKNENLNAELTEEHKNEIRWRNLLPLGFAYIFNLMFHHFDTLMLNEMSNLREVGLYNGSYKLLFFTFALYHQVTYSLFPKLTRSQKSAENFKKILYGGLGAFVFGILICLIYRSFSYSILNLIYGDNLSSAQPIFEILALNLPLEFFTSWIALYIVALGLNRLSLIISLIGTIINILLNLYLIPQYQAVGASWATIISYLLISTFYISFLIWWKRNQGKTA
ncbi:MAG: polysaccharide biosynthesis C-terminal domain-containing protein [Deltaproteobacteria bacterium]|nr:polysaccharide biosynthesis C-terminal domain-containing protein [Deltaproteobacteria bacterium]